MDKKVIDNIVWWIPFRKLRNSIRDLLLYNLETRNLCSNLDNKIDNLIQIQRLLNQHYLDNIEKKISALFEIYKLSNINNVNNVEDFKGQIGHDIIAYLCLKNKKNGFYIDIGAYDGIKLSNTYIFEKLGWNGFCVEANPKTFESLKKNRRCDAYNYALSSVKNEKAKFITSSVDVLDVLEMHKTDRHENRIIKESNNNIKYIEVPTITFEELMNKYENIEHIDFMSLDIEGGELDVLKSINFNKYSFGLITVEFNNNYNEIKHLMFSNGYKVLIENHFDIIFIKNNHIDFCLD